MKSNNMSVINFVVVALCVATVMGRPQSVVTPDQRLDMLPPEELEGLLDELLYKHLTNINNDYEEAFEMHEMNRRHIFHEHQRRRQRRSVIDHFEDNHYDEGFFKDAWHNFIINTGVNNRQVVAIDNITDEQISLDDGIKIEKSFPLHLHHIGISALFKSEDSYGYIIDYQDKKLKPILVSNEFTVSHSGCSCTDNIEDGPKTCACCNYEGCLCNEYGKSDTCVKCGMEQEQCENGGHQPLKLESATAFTYHLDSNDPDHGHKTIFITTMGTQVQFLTWRDGMLHNKTLEDGRKSLYYGSYFSQIAYADTYVDYLGDLVKKRFLFIFETGKNGKQLYHDIEIDPKTDDLRILSTRVWHVSGQLMKIIPSSGHIYILLCDYDNEINIYDFRADKYRNFAPWFIHKFKLEEAPLEAEIFSSHFDQNLLVTMANEAKIYQIRGNELDRIQTLKPENPISKFDNIIPIKMMGCGLNEVLLAVQGTVAITYVWNGYNENYTMISRTDVPEDIYWSQAVSCAKEENSGEVVVPGKSSVLTIRIYGHLENLPNPFILLYEKAHNQLEKIEEEFEHQEDAIDKTLDALSHSVSESSNIDGTITINNSVDFLGVLQTLEVEASMIMIDESIAGQTISNEEYLQKLTQLESDLDELNSTIINLGNLFSDAVPKNVSGVKIIGSKTIEGGNVKIPNLEVGDLSVNQALQNGIEFPLQETIGSLVRKDYTGIVKGIKTFPKNVKISRLETNTLDDIPVSDLVTNGGDEIIAGAVFEKGIFVKGNLSFYDNSTVGGKDPTKIVGASNQIQHLGICRFNNTLNVTGDLDVMSKMVDGINLDDLASKTLKRGNTSVLQIPLDVSNFIIVEGNVITDTVMGENFTEFLDNVVLKDKPSNITGHLTYKSDVTIFKNLIVGGLINNKSFPTDYPLANSSHIDFGNKTFVSLETDHLNVTGLVDEKKTEDFLTKTTNQTVNNTKAFDRGIDVKGDLNIVSGMIDGLNISSLKMISEMNYTDIKNVVFKKNLEVESLNITEYLNGFNFKEVIDDLVLCDKDEAVIDSVKTFKNLGVRYANITSNLNNEDMSTFVTTNKSQTINGHIIFNGVTHFRNLDVNGTVDGVDIATLYSNALYMDKPDQEVTGKKTFSDNTTMNSLNVHQYINDVDFTRVVTISGDQNIFSIHNFTNPHFENLHITNIKQGETALIDGVDIDDFIKRRLTTSGAQSIVGNIVIECPVNGTTLHSERINGYDLDDLVNNIVMNDVNVKINSNVIFTSMNILGPITTKDQIGANGFSLAEIASKAFWLDGSENNMPYGNFEHLEINDLIINGLVDGINIEDLINDAVFGDNSTNITVTGNKTFSSGMHVQSDIETSMVNGLNYSSQLLLNKGDQIITGQYTFKYIRVMKNVILNGSLNGIDMEDFEKAAIAKENVTFNDSVILTGNTTINWMDVDGLFNNFMLYDTYNEAVCENTSEILGTIKFNIPPEFSNLNITTLNGEDFGSFLADVVFKDSDACVFENDIKIDGVMSANAINVNETDIKGSLDRIACESLFTEAIYLSKDYNISAYWTFAGGAIINGNIGVEFLKDIPITEYLTSHTPQNITHTLKFDQLTSHHVNVIGTVNGLNLTEEYSNTLFGTGGEIVTGNKTFIGLIMVQGDVHITNKTGRYVKIDLSEDTIRIDESNNAVIQGPVTFTGPLKVESCNVDGSVNSVDLDVMFDNAWYRDQPTNFSDAMVFKGHVIMEGGLNLNKSYPDDYYKSGIHELGSRLLSQYREVVKYIDSNFGETCEDAIQMYNLMENSIYEADYLHFVTLFKSAGVHRSSTTFEMNGKTYFVINWQDNCNSSIYRWDTNNNTFVHEQDFESGYAYDWVALPYTNPAYVQLVMSAGLGHNNCNIENTTIWDVHSDGNTITVDAIQTLPASIGVSVMDANDRLKLNLYNENEKGIIKYKYESDVNGTFEFHDRLRDDETNKYVYGYNAYGSEIGFEVSIASANMLQNDSTMIVFENGELLSEHTLHSVIVDAVALEQDGKVLLVLLLRETILDISVLAEELYYITVYDYDIVEMAFVLMSYEKVQSSGSLVTFAAGNEASRLVFVTFIQERGPVIVYSLLGETLKLWTTLPIYVPTWTLPFSIREPNGYDKPYLLLGWDDTQEVIILTMEMRGFTVRQYGGTCDIPEFNMTIVDQYQHQWYHQLFNNTI